MGAAGRANAGTGAARAASGWFGAAAPLVGWRTRHRQVAVAGGSGRASQHAGLDGTGGWLLSAEQTRAVYALAERYHRLFAAATTSAGTCCPAGLCLVRTLAARAGRAG